MYALIARENCTGVDILLPITGFVISFAGHGRFITGFSARRLSRRHAISAMASSVIYMKYSDEPMPTRRYQKLMTRFREKSRLEDGAAIIAHDGVG